MDRIISPVTNLITSTRYPLALIWCWFRFGYLDGRILRHKFREKQSTGEGHQRVKLLHIKRYRYKNTCATSLIVSRANLLRQGFEVCLLSSIQPPRFSIIFPRRLHLTLISGRNLGCIPSYVEPASLSFDMPFHSKT